MQMRRTLTTAAFLVAAAAIATIEIVQGDSSGVSIILTIAMWKAISEGCVALAAAAELTKAKWVAPIKRPLLSFYPLILLTSLLTVLLVDRLDLYPWMGSEGIWLNKWFFLGRNIGASLLVFVLGWRLAVDPRGTRPGRGPLLVAFLLAFVTSQSLLAFDLVMSLEHPWISTLFGGYFFIEALYAGMAVSGVLCFFLRRSADPDAAKALSKTVSDVATLIFGFSLLWAGLFYAQYLVIWYGNIPEEAGFLVRRIEESPLRELSYSVLIALFFAPFVLLLSRRAKRTPAAVLLASVLVLYGALAERIIYLSPVARLSPITLVAESLALLVLSVLLVRRSAPASLTRK